MVKRCSKVKVKTLVKIGRSRFKMLVNIRLQDYRRFGSNLQDSFSPVIDGHIVVVGGSRGGQGHARDKQAFSIYNVPNIWPPVA